MHIALFVISQPHLFVRSQIYDLFKTNHAEMEALPYIVPAIPYPGGTSTQGLFHLTIIIHPYYSATKNGLSALDRDRVGD